MMRTYIRFVVLTISHIPNPLVHAILEGDSQSSLPVLSSPPNTFPWIRPISSNSPLALSTRLIPSSNPLNVSSSVTSSLLTFPDLTDVPPPCDPILDNPGRAVPDD
jgi:hypothetical protein